MYYPSRENKGADHLCSYCSNGLFFSSLTGCNSSIGSMSDSLL